MPSTYRRPGVYLEESLLLNPSDVAGTNTVSAFVGLAPKGPINTPYLVESWSDYFTVFGGFESVPPPTIPDDPNNISSSVFGATAPPADLAALKAHPTFGDGDYSGTDPFPAGAYVVLGDDSKAHYDTDVWTAGAMTGAALPIPTPVNALSYMPFSVYSFFQNGGRFAWITRAVKGPAPGGKAASMAVTGATPSFTLRALSAGAWGNKIGFRLSIIDETNNVFALETLQQLPDATWESLEFFNNLTVKGTVPGTRRVDSVINDLVGGSKVVRVTNLDLAREDVAEVDDITALTGGEDPSWPQSADLLSACQYLGGIEGPMAVNICGYLNDESFMQKPGEEVAEGSDTTHFVGATFAPSAFSDREDVISINDYCNAKKSGATDYLTTVKGDLSAQGGSSYVAAYGPWILIPHPTQIGAVIPIPPGGAVLGVMARIDATIGIHRAPAGIIATISNAVGVQAKFTDSELGDLNYNNINIIRPMVGAGICIMGARTRKGYGPDHYISARRTLIGLKESLRRSTQYAVFENNDERLWSALRITAENVLRPMWERGGLRGASPAQAYYIRCDSTINTINVISSGEVRMEVGVALEYPAEYVVIRITQITNSTFTNEVQSI